MFNSPVLDLVILLSFVYFIGSLLLSAVNELIVSSFDFRQKHLKGALEKLFFDDGWKTFFNEVLAKSPHLQSLFSDKDKFPSYIPSKNFANAIIENIGPDNFVSDNLPQLISKINGNDKLPKSLKSVVLTIMAKTQLNVEKIQKELEDFYNDSMERASGGYKRKIKWFMFVIAFVLAAAMNMDTIKISRDALRDKNKLSRTADNISAEMARISLDSGNNVSIKDESGKVIVQVSSKIDTTAKDTVTAAQTLKTIKNLQIAYAQTSGSEFGYAGGFCKEWSENFWSKLLGILITVFALQLGANFWFDLLNKVVNLRASGKKPDEVKK